jgi:hypothetical protein
MTLAHYWPILIPLKTLLTIQSKNKQNFKCLKSTWTTLTSRRAESTIVLPLPRILKSALSPVLLASDRSNLQNLNNDLENLSFIIHHEILFTF